MFLVLLLTGVFWHIFNEVQRVEEGAFIKLHGQKFPED